jgi:DNA-binding transcriptional LysR family regulator
VATAELPSADDPRFELNQLLVDPLDLLLPENHRLAHEPYVQLADLADEAWIMDRPGRPYHQLLQSACAAAGFTPVVAHHAAEWDTGAAMVAAGLGIGLIPRLAHPPVGYAVVRVALSGEPTTSRRIVTGIRRGSREQPTIVTALRMLEEVAHTMTTSGPAPEQGH